MTLYTSTVVTPRRPARVWAKIGESTLYAIGLPVILVVLWGIWATVAPAKFFPSPSELLEAFVETWIGPAFFTDVLPTSSSRCWSSSAPSRRRCSSRSQLC